MIKLAGAVVLAASALASAPAYATGELVCAGQGVSIDMLVGHVDLLYIDRVVIEVGDKTWSSQPNVIAGTTITIGHVYQDERQVLVDFSSDGADKIGSLRVFRLTEGATSKAGGVFQLKDAGVWVVDCSDPE